MEAVPLRTLEPYEKLSAFEINDKLPTRIDDRSRTSLLTFAD